MGLRRSLLLLRLCGKTNTAMAAKRIAASAVNWGELAARVPANQKGAYNAFKGKSDAYLRAVMTRPEALPPIDFSAYAARVSVPGMVENFQKEYESIAIPYPADTVSGAIDGQEAAAAVETKEFVTASTARIAALGVELANWESMIPYDEMKWKNMPRDSLKRLSMLTNQLCGPTNLKINQD